MTFYGGEVKNKIEMFAAFGSEFAPAGPNIASYSPRHTIDCGKDIEFIPAPLNSRYEYFMRLTQMQAPILC